MEYEVKKKIHITCPHCEKAIETDIEIELEVKDKGHKDKKPERKSSEKKPKDKRYKNKKLGKDKGHV